MYHFIRYGCFDNNATTYLYFVEQIEIASPTKWHD